MSGEIAELLHESRPQDLRLAPVSLVSFLHAGSPRRIMGEFTMPGLLMLFGWLATAAMAAAVAGMFVMWGK